MQTRFIILSHARSGSTLLQHALNSHTNVRVAGDIFRYDITSKFPEYRVILHKVYGVLKLPSKNNIVTEDLDLSRVIDEIFKTYNGFKVLYYQLPRSYAVWNFIHSMPDLKVIHLTRTNWLEVIVSRTMSVNTGIYHRGVNDIAVQDTPVYLKPESVKSYFESLGSDIDYFSQLFSEAMNVTYEQLTTSWSNTTEAIQAYLNVPTEKLFKRFVKRTNNYSKLISNYQELKDYFADTEYAKFFTQITLE